MTFPHKPLVAALFCSGRSIYKHLPGVDPFDRHRNALTFDAKTPAVAHPPCRHWSKTLRQFAKSPDRTAEMRLGTWAVRTIRKCGGVLEHPAGSLLWVAMALPRPGFRDRWGFTVYVEQQWFGFAQRKATWLYICHVPRHLVKLPAFAFDRAKSAGLSQAGRSRTMRPFAEWLCQIAREARP